eukprot:scaffold818_cov136-Cylindrotheca_fusiformis.AAC.3
MPREPCKALAQCGGCTWKYGGTREVFFLRQSEYRWADQNRLRKSAQELLKFWKQCQGYFPAGEESTRRALTIMFVVDSAVVGNFPVLQ